tara:strand:- start:1611 stop:2705 length:1095 start_codon:yes stop_codon:yes gene_type:complete
LLLYLYQKLIQMKKINKLFFKKKSMPLDSFLDKVLYHRNFGYYQNKNPFGEKGDFVTAPNISNLFGEMITIWIVSFWEKLKKPKKINFIEMGPGNGDLCLSILQTLKNFPHVYKSFNIMLYERSEILRKIQRKRISSKKVTWIKNLKVITDGPVIFFGNEFLDALPIKQFKKINGILFEKYVEINKNNVSFFFKKLIKKEIKKLKNFKVTKNNVIIEYPEHGFRELELVCKKIKELNGGALFIDYGYIKENNFDTLQSVIKHKFNDIRQNVGKADITSLVNFNLYKKYFNMKNLSVDRIISQSEFLQKLGIMERCKILSNSLDNKDKSNLYGRVRRLIHPKMMGENFKVIFAKNKKCNFTIDLN